ncbi:hypothetical protein AB0395_40170 [Streptosporangium sp. NPDC051023]|uniref:hypothetical protein n=1 Tax=Streptosporangium sp. NPDC051023 TaxID=3155410 RepID=UPI00344BADD2
MKAEISKTMAKMGMSAGSGMLPSGAPVMEPGCGSVGDERMGYLRRAASRGVDTTSSARRRRASTRRGAGAPATWAAIPVTEPVRNEEAPGTEPFVGLHHP